MPKGGVMSDIYDSEWTIRGLVDVSEDIFLQPDDRLKISGSGNGPYAVQVLKGNKIWETCNDLMLVGKVTPTILVANDEARPQAVSKFVGTYDPEWQRLEGTLTETKHGQVVKAKVKIWTPAVFDTSYHLVIIRVKPPQGSLEENGTGHGDNR
jgi:hypothetical protein